jgi:hypothetical protein
LIQDFQLLLLPVRTAALSIIRLTWLGPIGAPPLWRFSDAY